MEPRRRRTKLNEDDYVLVGTKVSEGHQNYVTAYNMLTGIRVSVSRCNAKVKSPLTDADFRESHKLAFDISGNELTPSARYDFKFKDYAPKVFRDLREHFRLDPADYLMSLTAKYILSELGSPGKSGSFFYYSRDFRFIIKTVHHSEHKMLRLILREYYDHVKKHPHTLISQFYGLHRLELPFGHKVHFIIMNNLFPPDKLIHRTYDLKGSFLGRLTAKDKVKQSQERAPVLKDLNWLQNQEKIQLGSIKRQVFLNQLEKDIKLLQRLNLMDYSLLIGICDLTLGGSGPRGLSVFEPKPEINNNPTSLASPRLNRGSSLAYHTGRSHSPTASSFTFYHDLGGFQATDESNQLIPEIYYFGVIDCLTNYSWVKRLETEWRILETQDMKQEKLISAIPAREYGERFLKFIKLEAQPKSKV
ncbi:phosphatidylinositol-4-phosphate 5-kinase [Nadsonia fulvescens var. elongata DSM 6958]|uniref:1-phosphatidylinositol-4-phosphate 5-kinase n=1 Tax=Nadsonia fulvescens var. elongata DSM 6958 TaxID=857566 RepID=A0A1E3PCJ5_9ASCO|nr:phosphatidylinositol-4-phosphate 5-kinase [Nadsonia fulvescens var. elongata DSM 6958]